jgi:hypothetical protein
VLLANIYITICKILKCLICCSLVLLNNVDFLITAEVIFSSMPTYKIIS